MGISYHGITSLKFVTGTHKQVSKYINPKTKLPYKGVAKGEYTDVLRDHFTPEGNKMFAHAGKWADKWKLQQDNAPPHKTATNIADHVPPSHFLAWPTNSSDLSPIENLWAWMNSQVHKHHKCKIVEELKEKLEQVRQSIPASYLHAVFDGMNSRMKRVLELDGDYIGKRLRSFPSSTALQGCSMTIWEQQLIRIVCTSPVPACVLLAASLFCLSV